MTLLYDKFLQQHGAQADKITQSDVRRQSALHEGQQQDPEMGAHRLTAA